jgi:alpha-beta hydrolase superfamily lysophospholipase
MPPEPPDTIVLIHGFWATPKSWEEVADFALDWALRHAKAA